jgi:hypothetical protein
MDGQDWACEWYDPTCALGWISEEFKAIFVWLYDGLMSGFASVLESFPVPDFLLTMGVVTLPSGVAWAAEAFQLPLGAGIIVSAYTARFILRRIPFIG